MNIVVFGDSLSKGIISKDGKIMTVKENVIDILEKHYHIQITNHSQYGQTLLRLVQRGTIKQYFASIQPEEENIMVICIGGNDADYDWVDVAKNPRSYHDPKTPIKDFALLYQDVIKKAKMLNIKVVVTTIYPIHSASFFKNVISRLANPKKILQFFDGDIEVISRHQEAFNLVVVKTALENGCVLLDMRSRILLDREYNRYICYDGIHPTEEGYKRLGQLLIEEIDQLKVF